MESRKGDPKKLAALKHTLKTTDPFELSTRIDQQLQRQQQDMKRQMQEDFG